MTITETAFDLELIGDVTLIRFCVTELDEGNLDAVADELLEFITPDSPAKLVVDLVHIQRVNSAAAEMLAVFHDSVCDDRSEIRWCCVPPAVRDGMRRFVTHTPFDVRGTVSEAVAGF
jgi:anti-anti-sigma regulatory factor